MNDHSDDGCDRTNGSACLSLRQGVRAVSDGLEISGHEGKQSGTASAPHQTGPRREKTTFTARNTSGLRG